MRSLAHLVVAGNIGHQLSTRAYMDFMRMEAEFAFLMLLPPETRTTERAHWYRDTNERVYRDIVDELASFDLDTGVPFTTDHPKRELYELLWTKLSRVREGRWSIDDPPLPDDMAAALRGLAALHGKEIAQLPETAFLWVPDGPANARVFTLLRNAGHSNIASPFGEDDRRRPAEDTLTVARGFVGTYPNAFYVARRSELAELVRRIAAVRTEADYAALQRGFGVRRTDTDFWATSDALAEHYRRRWPVEAGLLDLARYENR